MKENLLCIPLINIKVLLQELKRTQKNKETTEMTDLNSKSTQTKKTKIKWIKELVKTTWFLSIFATFFHIASDMYDLGTDVRLTKSFIEGANYTVNVDYTPESK